MNFWAGLRWKFLSPGTQGPHAGRTCSSDDGVARVRGIDVPVAASLLQICRIGERCQGQTGNRRASAVAQGTDEGAVGADAERFQRTPAL